MLDPCQKRLKMLRDFKKIPKGDDCSGCPYWKIIKRKKIPGGVPTVRCEYLDVENNPLINDSIKMCDVDLPDELPEWLTIS